MNKVFKKVENIIEGLGMHQDPQSIGLLEEVGTNSSLDCVRELTSRALIKKNMPDALKIVIGNAGKGINDLSSIVAMSSINELLSLKDKTAAVDVLQDTIENHPDEQIRDNARSVKALISLS
ncbi:MAG: hypothetical protein LBK53_05410 [Heliobacteriaceae bacterium]|jgi:hypothetical protein|nr:hypothetical protein [Heliobacteriaceae bacterium]